MSAKKSIALLENKVDPGLYFTQEKEKWEDFGIDVPDTHDQALDSLVSILHSITEPPEVKESEEEEQPLPVSSGHEFKLELNSFTTPESITVLFSDTVMTHGEAEDWVKALGATLPTILQLQLIAHCHTDDIQFDPERWYWVSDFAKGSRAYYVNLATKEVNQYEKHLRKWAVCIINGNE